MHRLVIIYRFIGNFVPSLLLCTCVCSSFAQKTSDLDSALLLKIRATASQQLRAFSYLEELSDIIGPRLTGSSGADKASQWALRKMFDMGLKKVHLENWKMKRGWQRGRTRARLIAPFNLDLNVTSYGWVGSTPSGGVDADVVLVNSDALEEEVEKNASRWAGKVLLLIPGHLQHSNGFKSFAQMGDFVFAAKRARAAAIIRRDDRPGTMLTHTGPVGFPGVISPIPVVDIAREHEMLLERLLTAGKTVRIRIDVQNKFSPGAVTAANVIGEIPGTEDPEKVVVVGAHLDSWDLGTGAVDDGFGVAAVLGSADVLMKSKAKPRRTIRFVLFTGEEQGLLGSRAYVRRHQAEMRNLVCAIVLDWGQGPIRKFPLAGHTELEPAFREFFGLVSGFGDLQVDNSYLTFTDAYSFTLAGVPGIAPWQDSPTYSMIGHSSADTLDKVAPDILADNAALLALNSFWIANREIRLGEVWSPDKTRQVLARDKQLEILQLLNLWPSGK